MSTHDPMGTTGGAAATRRELLALEAATRREMELLRAEVRRDLDRLRADVRRDMAQVRAGFSSELYSLRGEVSSDTRHLRTELRRLHRPSRQHQFQSTYRRGDFGKALAADTRALLFALGSLMAFLTVLTWSVLGIL